MFDICTYRWCWDRSQEDRNSSLAKQAFPMEFTFYTAVLWDFLGVSGDGGIDVGHNTFLYTSTTQEGKGSQGEIQ